MSYRREILIVDDEPGNLELLSNMLVAQRYDVRVANNGYMALASTKFSLPDLILLDINMPEMNGYEVCRRLKADPNTCNVPIIFISANDEAIDKVEAFSAGGVDYVTKPFQIEEVLARIESQLKIARLSRELQMQVLRYQLNPHFLFNSLMSIRNLIAPYNCEPATLMINRLSSYLRYLLMNRDEMEITVREEIEAARNYLSIEKIRFEERLEIKFDVDPEIGEYLMPAFILQPLLENAIKYGMRADPETLELELSARLKEEMLCFCVSNNGNWIKVPEKEIPHSTGLGVGLQNVRQRLKERYPGNHSFNILDKNGRVSIIIEIPLS
jgi:LytS/YehU family sensor histidine kinase